MIYLACPYSHPDREIRLQRFDAANRAAGFLLNRGFKVLSPLSHSHPIAEACSLPLDWEYWKSLNEEYLKYCNKIIVLTIEGWKESVGVNSELRMAAQLGIPVEYMSPLELGNED